MVQLLNIYNLFGNILAECLLFKHSGGFLGPSLCLAVWRANNNTDKSGRLLYRWVAPLLPGLSSILLSWHFASSFTCWHHSRQNMYMAYCCTGAPCLWGCAVFIIQAAHDRRFLPLLALFPHLFELFSCPPLFVSSEAPPDSRFFIFSYDTLPAGPC